MKLKGNFEAKEEFFMRNGALLLEKQISSSQGKGIAIRIFSAEELIRATNNYDPSLIRSRIKSSRIKSTVYKGILHDRVVAVKTSEGLQISSLLIEIFLNQAVTQIQINHKHVVRLLGCCLETEIPILVQEFITNDTLSNHIASNLVPFSWSTRLRVATEIADAVTYLHCFSSNPIIHRDIRSNSVLFDEDYVVKLSNFGFSVVIPSGKTGTEFEVKGVKGYIDPEYVETSRLSEKCDVYSFGVLLLELLYWKIRKSEPLFIQDFISSMECGSLVQILDGIVKEEEERAQVLAYGELALGCIQSKGEERPTMIKVAKELRRIRGSKGGNTKDSLPLPPRPSKEEKKPNKVGSQSRYQLPELSIEVEPRNTKSARGQARGRANRGARGRGRGSGRGRGVDAPTSHVVPTRHGVHMPST